MSPRSTILAALVVLPVLAVAAAQERTATPRGEGAAAVPEPLTEYLGRPIAVTMHYAGAPWLVREGRQREEDCETMLKELKVTPGMTVVDMGCGNGFYTLPLGQQVGPTGKVIGVDIQQEMLRLLEARAEDAALENIELVLGLPYDPQLEPETVDLILCVDVYHEFSYPEQMLAAMRRSLKPSGLVVLVEFREEDPEVPIKPAHKMSKRQVMKELTANGYRLVREFDGLPWQHMMFFGRDEPAE